MKRVLIITYYWPPNGGTGVFRWLKMSKYLPEHGWQPIIYTPSNPELVADDPELLKDVRPGTEVWQRPITEPFSLYKRFTGKKQEERVHTAFLSEEGRSGWKEDLALWVRSNFFVPDARVWWVRPSIAFLKERLRSQPVDAIITTGPPHSMHLIGRGLKRALGIPWVADFRDPWTGIDFYKQLKLSARADARHRRMERSVLTEADRVITVSWSCAEELSVIGGRDVDVVTNGFDPADVPVPAAVLDNEWSLVHVGSMSATRDCPGLWKALAEQCAKDPVFRARFKLRFVGPVDRSVLESVDSAGLTTHVERIGRVSHQEAMVLMQRARVLLLAINDVANSGGILTTKLFEYLSVGRPVLAVGAAGGDVARMLAAPHLVTGRTLSTVESAQLRALFEHEVLPAADIGRFGRAHLAGQVAQVLGSLVRSA